MVSTGRASVGAAPMIAAATARAVFIPAPSLARPPHAEKPGRLTPDSARTRDRRGARAGAESRPTSTVSAVVRMPTGSKPTLRKGVQSRPFGKGVQSRPFGKGVQSRPFGKGVRSRPFGKGVRSRAFMLWGAQMDPPADHPPIPAPKVGVLLINLGTPNAPEAGSVRLYLKEFLSDPRVVEIPQLVWQPILRGLILTTRPRKSAHAYRQVWTEEGSPLAVITARQAKALAGAFGADVIVDHAMRYGRPAISERIDALRAAGCERILIAPLYPQY